MLKQAKWMAFLCGALLGAFMSQVVSAGPLNNAVVTGSYAKSGLQAGQSAVMVGGDVTDNSSLVTSTPGGLIAAVIESDGSYSELPDGQLYQPYWVGVDDTGFVQVFNMIDPLAPATAGSQVVTLSFAGAAASIASFVSSDLGGILSVIDDHTVALDLSGISWAGLFSSYTAQIGFAAPGTVPEPASLALLGLALLGLQFARRARG